MTAITGASIAGLTYGKNPAALPQSVAGSNIARTGFTETPMAPGVRIANQPTSLQKVTLQGSIIQNLSADIFNRIWVIPLSLAFGDISISNEAISKSVRLWNAYPHTKQTLTSLNVVNDADVGVQGISLPLTMPAFSEVEFDVVAAPFGKQALNAYIPVMFTTLGDVWDIQITGNRLENLDDVLQFSPTTVDFGMVPLTSTETQEVTIWNADSVRPMTISGMSVPSGQGITVSGMTFPYTIPPLGNATFYVTALPSDEPYIATTISVTVSTIAATYSVGVYGTRFDGQVLSLVPDWSSPVQVSFSYQTDIFTARDGTEQRRALRQTPRRIYSFSALLYGQSGTQIRSLIRKWAAGFMFLADPTRGQQVSSGLPAGTDRVTLDEIPRWLVAGNYVVMSELDQAEFRKVASIAGNVVIFSNTSENEWSSQAKVCACLYGRLSANPQMQILTNTVAQLAVMFECQPGTETDTSTGTQGATYDSRELLPFSPQWANPLSNTVIWEREVVDYGFGLTEYYTPTTFGVDSRQASVLCDGNVQDVIDFFGRMRGQAGEFFATTYQSDMSVVSLNGTSMVVEGDAVYDFYQDDSPIGFLAVKLVDGSMLYSKITAVSVDGERNSVLTLDSAITANGTLTAAGISSVSWLSLSRFMSDTLSVNYLTDTVATVDIVVGSRPYAAAD